MGFPISKRQSPTMSLTHDSDCFNGKSSVGKDAKYTRLNIDYKKINERDFPDEPEEDDDVHPLDWDHIDEDGEDVFDRMGFLLFGGSGLICTVFRNVIGPTMSMTRNGYRNYIADFT